jgi:hypothetical protein
MSLVQGTQVIFPPIIISPMNAPYSLGGVIGQNKWHVIKTSVFYFWSRREASSCAIIRKGSI